MYAITAEQWKTNAPTLEEVIRVCHNSFGLVTLAPNPSDDGTSLTVRKDGVVVAFIHKAKVWHIRAGDRSPFDSLHDAMAAAAASGHSVSFTLNRDGVHIRGGKYDTHTIVLVTG